MHFCWGRRGCPFLQQEYPACPSFQLLYSLKDNLLSGACRCCAGRNPCSKHRLWTSPKNSRKVPSMVGPSVRHTEGTVLGDGEPKMADCVALSQESLPTHPHILTRRDEEVLLVFHFLILPSPPPLSFCLHSLAVL